MSIEIVTSPKNGVTISLAGHTLFGGHRLCFTLDAIKGGSRAESALGVQAQRECYRSELQHNKPLPGWDRLACLLRGVPFPAPPAPSSFSAARSRISSVLNRAVGSKLEALSSKLANALGVQDS